MNNHKNCYNDISNNFIATTIDYKTKTIDYEMSSSAFI